MVSELLSIFSFVSEKITNLPLILHLIAVNYQLQLGDELIPIKYSITQLTSNIIPNKKAPSQKYVISLFRCPLHFFSKCPGTQLIRLKSLRISQVSPPC